MDDPPIKSPPLSPSFTYSSASSVASFDGDSHHYWPAEQKKPQKVVEEATEERTEPAAVYPYRDYHQQRRHYTYSAYSFHSNDQDDIIKPKRRRANAIQLEVLNRVFERTFFPSTQTRAELGRQLGMSPRTVQIWFQNRRQAIRMRERQRVGKPLN
ncbi:hypothetical protein DFQ28_011241 [Apophysomyces sp. BC1034]|nr:hypothetical protein DFQ30_007053 [Apophysomyces sp. BC1015]KAG0181453.1 hypothetical protein DFQ29_008235 [Apophysomyces sp. BC1021]KAG0194440.1 hypothetical protein DFQ28_011241 [Apophysomyces sp. BC1034]